MKKEICPNCNNKRVITIEKFMGNDSYDEPRYSKEEYRCPNCVITEVITTIKVISKYRTKKDKERKYKHFY